MPESIGALCRRDLGNQRDNALGNGGGRRSYLHSRLDGVDGEHHGVLHYASKSARRQVGGKRGVVREGLVVDLDGVVAGDHGHGGHGGN